MATNTAATTNGTGTVNTTTIVNSIQGEKELMFTVKNVSSSAKNFPIFLGADTSPEELAAAIKAGIPGTAGLDLEFTMPDFGNDPKKFWRYFQKVRTFIPGARLDSDNTVSFDGYFNITERQPDGTTDNVKIYTNKYKLPLGGGTYANSVEVPKEVLKIAVWPGLEVLYMGIPAGATMTFHFPVAGWSKPGTLSPLRTKNL